MSNAREVKRTLYVCAWPPSGIVGAGVILENLFADFPTERLGVVAERSRVARAEKHEGDPLPWRTYRIRLPRRLTRPGVRVIGNVLRLLRLPLSALQISIAVRRFGAEVIFAVQDGGQLFVAAWIAHKLTRRDLYVYAMDDWEHAARMHGWLPALTARLMMGRIVRSAARAWAISPLMQEDWRARFGVTPRVLWHSVDLNEYRPRPTVRRPQEPLRFVCVASIYGVNADAFNAVLNAFREVRAENARLELILYTAARESLSQFGIEEEPGFIVAQVDARELPAALAACDVAVLALGFAPEWRRAVEVAVPTKLAEYLAASLPVLVHAPAGAAASLYVAENDAGVVVNQEDVGKVAAAMRTLIADAEFRVRLGSNARRLAEQNHSRDRVTVEFLASFR